MGIPFLPTKPGDFLKMIFKGFDHQFFMSEGLCYVTSLEGC